MHKRPLKDHPSRMIASRVFRDAESMEVLKKTLNECRSTGMKRDVYFTLVAAKVIVPMARQLGFRASTEAEYNEAIKQATARVLRSAYSVG